MLSFSDNDFENLLSTLDENKHNSDQPTFKALFIDW